ncbi:diacylglycerol/lipid kinase family protein [Clostridiisalibacter paucivorans]|uniref:diacylglycerol/lipid kinase family protein n=1 Tax=Clostridiisalibacter paucivorans TaxID=408753 RepID=UPI000478A569|nr:YegS/Rv2252/BmrU family lipid kinase [Clostridiisalibacter paucivorans]
MKKVRIIYNPSSGRQIMEKRIDMICKILINKGYIIGKFATKKKNDAMNETIKCCKEDWDIIIACGGDGTVNEIATGILLGGRKIPVAILAGGTVNDFSNDMGLPRSPKKFCNMIDEGKTEDVDVGEVNGKYFVNVAAGGLLTNVAHQVPIELKTILGRMAYYIEGLKEIPKQKFKPIRIRVESEEYSGEEDILLFLISNGKSIGGFKKLAPKAEVKDGYLDCIIIKKSEIQDIISIFMKLFMGEHINHPNVIYFKTRKIYIESNDKIDIDIDGEHGGILPATFNVIPNAFRILVNK